jgi:hypothetical protein
MKKMSLALFVMLVVFVLSYTISNVYASTNKPKVFVHYMPWFVTMPGQKWPSHWSMSNCNPDIIVNGKRDICSKYYPQIGPFNNSRSEVLEYDTLLMKMSGVDGVIIDWPGIYDVYDAKPLREVTELLMDKLDKTDLEYSIMWEDRNIPLAIEKRMSSTLKAAANSTLEYAASHYFNRKNYTKFSNRPLLTMFGPQSLQVLTKVDWDSVRNSNGNPLIYGLSNNNQAIDGEFTWIANWSLSFTEMISVASNKRQSLKILSAYPGFEDSYKKGGWGQGYKTVLPNNGETFKETLRIASENNPDVIQIATWNDWGEGTNIQPSIEKGMQYLEILQKFSGTVYSHADLNIPLRLFELRQQNLGNIEANETLDGVFDAIISGDVSTAQNMLTVVAAN